MLVETFRCPACDALLQPKKPQPEGKRIKCPVCAQTFAVRPEEESETAPNGVSVARRRSGGRREKDEEEVRPARRSRKKQGRSVGLMVGLAAGVLFLLVLGGAGVAGAFWLLPNVLDPDNPNVTDANWARVQLFMSRDQVESILGPGRPSTGAEMAQEYRPLFRSLAPDSAAAAEAAMAQKMGANTLPVYRWKNKNAAIFALFDGPGKEAKMGMAIWFDHNQATFSARDKTTLGDVPFGPGARNRGSLSPTGTPPPQGLPANSYSPAPMVPPQGNSGSNPFVAPTVPGLGPLNGGNTKATREN